MLYNRRRATAILDFRRSIATTEKYLHTLPSDNDAALDALAAIRGRPKPNGVGIAAPVQGMDTADCVR